MLQRARTLEKHTFPPDWTPEEIQRWLEVWKQVRAAKEEFRRVVFVSGVFDLFHEEHQRFLEKARAAGNFLVVGIESDTRVREAKGPGRPFDDQQARLNAVLLSGVVDAAAVLPEHFHEPQHHRALIGLLRPDVLAISSHSPHQEAKKAVMAEFGGRLVVVHEHNPAVSTTKQAQKRTMNQS